MNSVMSSRQSFVRATSVGEALEQAQAGSGDFRFLAGGTDVMPNRQQGNDRAANLIDISGIEALQDVAHEGNFLRIGALVRLDALKDRREVTDEFPALAEAARAVGSPLIRKSATIGGNLLCENRCIFYNQSEWWRESAGQCLKTGGDKCLATGGAKACFAKLSSDMAPVLISLDAELELASPDGIRRCPLEELYTGDGLRPRSVSGPAIITAVLLPRNRGFRTVFRKLRQRASLEFTSLTTAVTADRTGQLKLAMAGVDPAPVVIRGQMSDDGNDLITHALKKSRTVDNDRYSRGYRREMVRLFLGESLEKLKSTP